MDKNNNNNHQSKQSKSPLKKSENIKKNRDKKENKDKNPSQLILSVFCPDMSDIEVDIRTDENVHGVTDPSAAGPATQSRYNRDVLRPNFQNKFPVWGHKKLINIKFRKSKMSFLTLNYKDIKEYNLKISIR